MPDSLIDTTAESVEFDHSFKISVSGQLGMTDPPFEPDFRKTRGGQLGRQARIFLDPFWDRFPL